jgi:Ca-activated chloride channel homolog
VKIFLRLLAITAAFVALCLATTLPVTAQYLLSGDVDAQLHDLLGAIWQRSYFKWLLFVVPLVLYGSTLLQAIRRPHVRLGTVFPLTRGPRGFRTYLVDLPYIVRAASLVFLIAAMCRPINVKKDERAEDKGIDIVLVMDLSGSMRAILDGNPDDLPGAPDLNPKERLTRLDTAKIVVKDFVSRRKSDRIGVVVFARRPYILSPPTLDYALLSRLVSKLSLRVIDDSGTGIGDALSTGVARLRNSDAQSKVIVLLTDGDNNAGEVSPMFAAQLAKDKSIKIYTVQIGNGAEAEVEAGVDAFGNKQYAQQRFPVNPELLRQIAETTEAEAFIATDGRALADSMHSILDRLEKTTFEAPRQSFQELFPWFLVPGVMLIGLEILLRVLLLRRFP